MFEPKRNTCPKGETRKGKHSWVFVKNTTVSKMTFGPNGSHGSFSVRGLYCCECGATRVGQSRNNAPGSDLRDQLGALR